jgi:hypothetical protein
VPRATGRALLERDIHCRLADGQIARRHDADHPIARMFDQGELAEG